MLEQFFTTANLINLATLTFLEIILGVDNIIFIALLVQPLAINKRSQVRFYGISFALILRILMLFAASYIVKMHHKLFSLYGHDFSGRSLLLILGGAFLVVKVASEFVSISKKEESEPKINLKQGMFNIVTQIIVIDIILSFDSIITAVGMSPNNIGVIIVAVIISMVIMLILSKTIGEFIYRHPTIKILALNFIGLIGIMLIINGFDIEISKNYLYFAIIFAIYNEIINIKLCKNNG